MQRIGGYEITGELSRSGRGVVYRARRAGEGVGEGGYTIRTREDPFGVIPPKEWEAIAEEFLTQAADQQRAAEAGGGGGGGHWARVFEQGRFFAGGDEDDTGEGGGGGAYCVTEFFDVSADRLAATQQALSAAAVSSIVRQAVAGLVEIERACGRPHGQLSAARVLIHDRQKLESTRVVLIDPLPPGRVDAARDRERDARSVAELIHLLIAHRAVNERVWPVPEGREWQALGNKGRLWLALTNKLLDPSTGAERPTPEQILGEIGAIDAAKGGGAAGGKKIAVAAAAAIVLLGGGLGGYLALKPSSAVNGNGENGGGGNEQPDIGGGGDLDLAAWGEQQQTQWSALCTAYRQWLDPLVAESRKAPVQQAWQKAGLGELPQLLSQVNEGDPRRIAEAAGVSPELVRLERSTPDDVKRTKYIERVGSAAAALERINALFSTGENGWAMLVELKTRAGEYRQRGWEAAADAVERAVTTVEPGSPRAATLITQTISLNDSVAKVDALWQRLETAQQRMNELTVVGSADGETPDPILAKYSQWSAAAGASGKAGTGGSGGGGDALASVEAGLERALTTADELVAFLDKQWKGLDHELLRESGEYAELLTAEPTAETFNRFKVVAGAYPSLDPATDPRRGWTPEETLTRIAQTMDEMAQEPLSIDVPQAMREQLAGLQEESAALAKLPWNTRYEQQVRDRFVRAADSLKQLETRAQGMLAAGRARLATSHDEVKRELEATQQIAASAALNGVWQAGRDAMIGQYPAEKFGELRAAADALQEAIKEGEAAMPRLEVAGGAGGDVGRIIADEAAGLREQRISEALAAAGARQTPTPAVLQTALASAAEAHKADLTRLQALSNDAAAASTLLAGAYGLSEQAPAAVAGVDSLAAYADKWKDDATAAKLASINDRIAALRAIAQQSDPAALTQRVRQASAQTPETAIAAWRKLGQLGGAAWPGIVQQLETERDFAGLLRGAIGGVNDSTRQRALLDELAATRKSRWARFADSAPTAGDLESALAMMGDFGVSEAELSPRQSYNLAVQRLRTAARAAGTDDDAARAAAERFEQAVKALPGEVTAQGGNTPSRAAESISSLLAEQPPPEPVFVPADNGPGRSGWSGTLDQNGEVVRYTRGNNTLVFHRVEAPGGAMFVQVSEVTLGQFQAIVESGGGGGWGEIGQILMESYRPGDDDFRDGPCVWRWDRGRLVKSASWLAHVDDPTLDVPLYALGIRVDDNFARGGRQVSAAAGGETTEAHPMQRVSALAAAYVAQLAGCRLPSPEEWLAAKQAAAGTGDGGAANVRDQTWATQQQYAEQIMQTGRDRFPQPSAGSFDPAGSSAADPASDGVLWFRAAGAAAASGAITEMSGNVAEYAVGNAAALESASGVEPLRAALSGEGAGGGAGGVHVMGRSALSPPGVGEERDATIAALDSSADGYADVGFRLVFSAAGTIAAPPPLAQRVLEALDESGYLLGGQ